MNRGGGVGGMLLNEWSTTSNGHRIAVRNYFFAAELLVDDKVVDRAPGVFRHELRAVFGGPQDGAPRVCSAPDCGHENIPRALFCGKCGKSLPDATHRVRAIVSGSFPPPQVTCRIYIDGNEALIAGR
jgi:hypothetical protein